MASFENTIGDITHSFALRMIDSGPLTHVLVKRIRAAALASSQRRCGVAQRMLLGFRRVVNADKGHFTQLARQTLLDDVDSLLAQLCQ